MPSPSMGRDITVQFQGGGPHAVYLLDGMRAQDDRSGWDINTDAFAQFNGSGVSVVMPVGGGELYTDWYGPAIGNAHPNHKWETFLTSELPGWLQSQPRHRSRGNAVVGLSMSGSAALILAAYHPGNFIYAASLSGYLTIRRPPGRSWSAEAMAWAQAGSTPSTCGASTPTPRGSATIRPFRVRPSASNNTRIWIHNGTARPPDMDPAAETRSERLLGSVPGGYHHRRFTGIRAPLSRRGRQQRSLQLSPNGIHSWGYWGGQLIAMNPIFSVLGVPAPLGEHWAAGFPR